ncbi:shikimate kinase [Flavobacterium selenitireducens]|uniref:shikimate kinase n=1 Tax=Flavobacterium selenitireducens TaxID=2722704 RepID=UPI00168A80E9|nr:shikimate kinase [Flavobacterium selenitireducens]MBD3582840.1 shikimate kinase [Flavobacterium selenitireducens]
MKKVLLCGYMGSGKSTIGKKIAQMTGLPFRDLDDIVEQMTGMPISQLFKQKGELYFRKIEHEAFKSAMESHESFVLSLGGGTPAYANNHLMLNGENVVSFYLRACVETLFERLKGESENRPLIAGKANGEMKEHIAKNLFDRSYYYNQSSHAIAIDGKSVAEVAREILQKLT